MVDDMVEDLIKAGAKVNLTDKQGKLIFRRLQRPPGYTAKNTQVLTSVLVSCNYLLQQADIRMRSHDDLLTRLLQVDCLKMLFQQAFTSLQVTNSNKPDLL